MAYFCPYCTQLTQASQGQNYCSNAGDHIGKVENNAFYFKQAELDSGTHISRLSIRMVLDGYQYYKTGRKESIVKKDNYLIINEGEIWHSEIHAEKPVEALIVAFHPEYIKKAAFAFGNDSSALLDNPFHQTKEGISFEKSTYAQEPQIARLFLKLKGQITSGECSDLYYEEIYLELMHLIFQNHQNYIKQSELIPLKKPAVRKELLKRLSLAKDYIDVYLKEPLSLDLISENAALSPYHFLRLFKSIYQITPHQYILKERMHLAKYMVLSETKTVKEIAYEIGYEDQSAFNRVFKRFYKKTPLQIRNDVGLNKSLF